MKKAIDCVRMKWEIQRRHADDIKRFGKAKADRHRWQRVLDDPVLKAFVESHPVGEEARASSVDIGRKPNLKHALRASRREGRRAGD